MNRGLLAALPVGATLFLLSAPACNSNEGLETALAPAHDAALLAPAHDAALSVAARDAASPALVPGNVFGANARHPAAARSASAHLETSKTVLAVEELSDCDPLAPAHCMLPFPNNFWLREDSSTASGYRVHFGEDTMPKDKMKQGIDPTEWNTLDGFSPIPAIMAYFPDVSLYNAPRHWDISRSLDADCPTVLLHAETGERIPHFAELNENESDPFRKAFMIWPASRLKDAHRYIVAIRYLEDTYGNEIPPSEAFEALRDDIPTTDNDVEARRGVFADIFSRLNAAGVARSDLQLAWDFSTASRDCLTKRMVFMRDDAMARLPRGGPRYRITAVRDDHGDHIYRQIIGNFEVPYYLTSPRPGSTLVLDENGVPVYQGTAHVRFTVSIPRSLVDNHQAGAILQYGHGLLGDQNEIEAGYLEEIAGHYGYVLCAVNWWGMSAEDTPRILQMMLQDVSNFKIIPDRSHQGVLNALVLMRLMTGGFANDDLVTFDGVSVIDPNRRFYYGNSQGGILGGVYMALTQDVRYGTLGVAGAPYGLMLPRSVDFEPFFDILRQRYPDSMDQILLISIFEMLWDRAEPSGYVNAITSNLLPNTPVHRVLFQYGLGDAQVHYLATETMARSVGAVVFDPYVTEGDEVLFGFNTVHGPVEQSVMVGYDFGVPDEPTINVPPDEAYDTHEKPRRELTAQDQMDLFFRTGVIQPFCDGACDPD